MKPAERVEVNFDEKQSRRLEAFGMSSGKLPQTVNADTAKLKGPLFADVEACRGRQVRILSRATAVRRLVDLAIVDSEAVNAAKADDGKLT